MTAGAGAPRPDRSRLLHVLVVLVAALVATLPGIAGLPPTDRDEARFVQASRQMVESGDPVDIRFQDQPRYKKPVGIYWLQAAAVKASGFGAAAPVWVYRLVSAFGIVAAALGLYWSGAALFGSRAGLIAGVMLAAMFGVALEARLAKTDAVLLASVVVAQGVLARAYLAGREGRTLPLGIALLFWAAQGVAILVKGPIAPLASLLTVAALVAVDRQWRWLKLLRPLPGLLLAAAVAAPWLVLITLRTGGAFWSLSVGDDLLSKVRQGQEGHFGWPGYYVLVYGLYAWPFALLAIDAGLRATTRFRSDPRLRFLFCWYVPFWLVFELFGTKLPHYLLPAYPAIALAVGWSLAEPAAAGETVRQGWRALVWWLAAAGQAIVTLALAGLSVALPLYLGQPFSILNAAAALLVVTAGILAAPLGRRGARQVFSGALYAVLSYALIYGNVLPALTPLWISPQIKAAVEANRRCPSTVLASSSFQEPSLVFLLGTQTRFLSVQDTARHLAADPQCAMALVADRDADLFGRLVQASGSRAVPLASVGGLNYSSGKRVALTLYGGP